MRSDHKLTQAFLPHLEQGMRTEEKIAALADSFAALQQTLSFLLSHLCTENFGEAGLRDTVLRPKDEESGAQWSFRGGHLYYNGQKLL